MRTFIAIELPETLQQQVHLVQEQLQAALRASKVAEVITWVPVAKIHITLRFLGETNPTQHEMIAQGLTQVALSQSSFSLMLGRLGCFPNFRKPNVVWLAVQRTQAGLQRLQNPIEALACAANFTPEKRPFAAHITLGRVRRNRNPAELRRTGEILKSFSEEDATRQPRLPALKPFIVNQFVYMQSELRPEGARYTPLKRYSLG